MTYSWAIKILTLVILTSSCGRIKWDPNFFVSDYINSAIVDRNGVVVYTDTPEFNNYACLSIDKIMELNEILIRARLPKNVKRRLKRKLYPHIKFIKEETYANVN